MRTLKLCLGFAACLAAPLTLRAAAAVTYASGPNFCTAAQGYPDMPYCTVGEIPRDPSRCPLPGSYVDFFGHGCILTGTPYVHVTTAFPRQRAQRYLGIRGKDNDALPSSTSVPATDHGFQPSATGVWDAYSDDIHTGLRARHPQTVLSTGQRPCCGLFPRHRSSSYISSGGSTDTSKDSWPGSPRPINTRSACRFKQFARLRRLYGARSPVRIGWDFIDAVMVSRASTAPTESAT
jgi:hypothetical protein